MYVNASKKKPNKLCNYDVNIVIGSFVNAHIILPSLVDAINKF